MQFLKDYDFSTLIKTIELINTILMIGTFKFKERESCAISKNSLTTAIKMLQKQVNDISRHIHLSFWFVTVTDTTVAYFSIFHLLIASIQDMLYQNQT